MENGEACFCIFMHSISVFLQLDQFLDDAVILGMYRDGLRSSHPIDVPVHDPAEINEIFDAISYQKVN
jgi:aminopeptidase N